MDTTTRAATSRKNADTNAADAKMAEALNNAKKPNLVEPGADWEARHVAKFRADNKLS
jgi:hypothetical protein